MPPPGDDVPTWDVLPIPHPDEENERPGSRDQLDPLTVTGKLDGGLQVALRLARDVLLAVWLGASLGGFLALLVGAPFVGSVPRNPSWFAVTAALMVATVLVRFVLRALRPSLSPPEVTVNSEGLTVTDVHGLTRRTTWADATNLYVGWYSRRKVVQELYVTWVDPSGENVVNNLGRTLELEEVHVAILRRAPENLALRLGNQSS
jgi:hypothetical protein